MICAWGTLNLPPFILEEGRWHQGSGEALPPTQQTPTRKLSAQGTRHHLAREAVGGIRAFWCPSVASALGSRVVRLYEKISPAYVRDHVAVYVCVVVVLCLFTSSIKAPNALEAAMKA